MGSSSLVIGCETNIIPHAILVSCRQFLLVEHCVAIGAIRVARPNRYNIVGRRQKSKTLWSTALSVF
jgi:hypothetical protein